MYYCICLIVYTFICVFIYLDPGFTENILHRFKREKLHAKNIEDVYDGSRYVEMQNYLSDPNNISFQVNTDGVALFKSSNRSIWPIYLRINELPPYVR